MRIVVAGACGLIGSNFVRPALAERAEELGRAPIRSLERLASSFNTGEER